MTPERWQQVKELFHAAVERVPAGRAAFLDAACAGDPSLREEIERLLASDDPAEDFIETSAMKFLAARTDGSADPVAGRRIGPYQVVREIGRGGMGAVYLAARADDQFRKQVAIKVIKRGMDSEAILRRFRQEQQILADLDHPNIARLIDGGATEDGLSYFIMEYVDGLPIDIYCDTHKLAIAERLKLFRNACAAIQYAHECQVIHRDLKPGNLLITRDGAPKLLDFGIAKVLDPERASENIGTTATALRPMTPEYASPEQVRGEPITPASDLYSLGVLLYELLTGHRPYRVTGHTPSEIERTVCETEPEKPSTVIRRIETISGTDGAAPITVTPESVSAARAGDPETLRRHLSGDLDHIVLMALRKEPKRRYASVEQLSGDIRRHLEGLPVTARKDTLWYRSTRLVRRNRAAALAGLFVLAMLLALVSVEFYRFARRGPVMGKTIDSAAMTARADLTLSEPVNLGPTINSEFNDRHPAISPNGLTLYFLSNRPGGLGGTDIWVSRRTRLADPWGEPKNLGPPLNSNVNASAPAFSPDGHRLYFASDRPGGCGGADLYVSSRADPEDDFGWGSPVNLGCVVNSPDGDFGLACFSDEATGSVTLYFHSNRPGGLGIANIYASTLGRGGLFGPAALVRELSSSQNDLCPSIRRDGLELFLTSNCAGSLGGFDLWVARRATTRDAWSRPVNLGPTVNTEFRESCPAVSLDGATLYFNSNRPGGHGGTDLYMTTLKRPQR